MKVILELEMHRFGNDTLEEYKQHIEETLRENFFVDEDEKVLSLRKG